jgi:hypothetical protein
MTNLFKYGRFAVIAALAVLASGCLGGGSSDGGSGGSGGPAPEPPAPPSNRAPTISGSPPTSLRVDERYDFTPTASDPDGDELAFVVSNAPSWATFESGSGRLHGTPGAGDVGQFEQITIVVSDGAAEAALEPFSISVNQVANGSVTLSWNPPTTSADGSAITDLAGYRIYYGRAPNDLAQTVQINNPGTTRWVIENLSPATWYFSMTSVDDAGLESTRTPVGSRTVT